LIANIDWTVKRSQGGMPDYSRNPLIVYWEMTRACALACRHCRAEAMPCADPRQLSEGEGRRLLEQIAAFGNPLPHVVLTGGDPLERPDLYRLIDDAVRLGISISITPAATPKLTRDAIWKLRDHGIESLGLSLDGSSPNRHDSIRGIPGCFDATMVAARAAAECGIPIQVNTLVSQETADDLPAIYGLLKTVNIMRWSLFFLISMGRGKVLLEFPAETTELLMGWIYDLTMVAPFVIKTTEAPSYRRVAIQRMRGEGKISDEIRRSPTFRGFGIRDGNGIVFVSHKGDVYPSGFLPLHTGNIRETALADIYRESRTFQMLRKPSQFKGKCGHCEYRNLCGGSRARAFAHTGDALESDPLCGYQPSATQVFDVQEIS
jgi:radical SAM protein